MLTPLIRQNKTLLLNFLRQNFSKYALAILCCTNMYFIYQLGVRTPVTHIMHYNIKYGSGISCYHMDQEDDLPSADSQNFTPPANSIFFHETSCKGDLDSRQACAVESAARAHPGWKINILFPGPVNTLSLKSGTLATMSKFSNVNFKRIHISEYAKGTFLEPMLAQNIFSGDKSVQQAGDVLKYLTLFKFGGINLDLDIIVAKQLDYLGRNFATVQDNEWISAAILRMSRDRLGREISKLSLRELQDFRPNLIDHNGPGVITRALKEMCSTKDISLMSADNCKGFEIYGPKNFYPIHHDRWELYWEPTDLTVKDEQIYTYHLWNQRTQNVKIPKNSLYVNIAKMYCPTIYEMFGDDFGV